MLRSDHTAIAVKHLGRSREFYEFLGGQVVSKPSPHFIEILLGDLRLHLVKATDPDAAPTNGPRLDHFCLSVDSVAELNAFCARLNDCELIRDRAPFKVEESTPLGEGFVDHCEQRPPKKTLYFHDPDGVMIEVRCYK